MKLLLCTSCSSITSLHFSNQSCKCGKCSGQYVDNINIKYSGDSAIILGFNNRSFIDAIRHQRANGNLDTGLGREFTAFIIPTNAPSIRKV